MTVPAVVSALLVALGLLLALLMAIAQRRLHRAAPPPIPRRLPGVSILKPLKGVDAHLRENLRSIFRLDYPIYEVILGAEDPGDPALAVARSVAAEHRHVPSVVVASPRTIGFNPKVNNLANLARVARHQTFLISDSNVRVPPGHLKNLGGPPRAGGWGARVVSLPGYAWARSRRRPRVASAERGRDGRCQRAHASAQDPLRGREVDAGRPEGPRWDRRVPLPQPVLGGGSRVRRRTGGSGPACGGHRLPHRQRARPSNAPRVRGAPPAVGTSSAATSVCRAIWPRCSSTRRSSRWFVADLPHQGGGGGGWRGAGRDVSDRVLDRARAGR